jgi:hypothetical protein
MRLFATIRFRVAEYSALHLRDAGLCIFVSLSSLEQKIHMDGVVGEYDLAVICPGQQASVEQCSYVAIHGFDIAPRAPCGFADGHWGGTGQCVQQSCQT